MASGLRELKLWQEAVALAGDVIRATRSAGRREIRSVVERLGLVGCAVAESVADAHGRYDARDQQRAYRAARRHLLVLETAIAIARHAGIIPAPTAAQLNSRAGNVSRLLAGYLSFLERQIAVEDAARAAAGPDALVRTDRPTPVSVGPAGVLASGVSVFADP